MNKENKSSYEEIMDIIAEKYDKDFIGFINSKVKDITSEQVSKYLGDDWELRIIDFKVRINPSQKVLELLGADEEWLFYRLEKRYMLWDVGSTDKFCDDSEMLVKDIVPENGYIWR